MVPLLAQIGAVLAVLLLARALLARAGLQLSAPQAAALAVVFAFTVPAVLSLRESWERLDDQAAAWKNDSPQSGADACVQSLGGDPAYVNWLRERIPENARYWMPSGPGRGYAPDICMRMVLLPRLQEDRIEDAQFAIALQGDQRLIDDLKRRGARVEIFAPGRELVRLP